MTTSSGASETGYGYSSAEADHTAPYLWPTVERAAHEHAPPPARGFDLGCGNGAFAARLHVLGYEMAGCDVSVEGIRIAQATHPDVRLIQASAYDDLASDHGTFDIVTSLEVVEHVYAPRIYAATLRALVAPGGVAIVSTPYHGYLKNVALAMSGKMDAHFTALWDHGHIKFWSEATLGQLLHEAGFASVRFARVGRVRAFAKSMVAIATP